MRGFTDWAEADDAQQTSAAENTLLGQPEKSTHIGDPKTTTYELKLQRDAIYPSPTKSRLMSLRNLWLPLHNASFALAVGLIYFVFAWVYQVSIAAYDTNRRLAANSILEAQAAEQLNEKLEFLSKPAESNGADVGNWLTARDAIRSLDRWRRAVKERVVFLNGPSVIPKQTAISLLANRAIQFGIDWDQASASVKNTIPALRKKLPDGFPIGLQTDGDLLIYFGLTGSQFALAAETHKISRSRPLAEDLKLSATIAAAAARSLARRWISFFSFEVS